MKPIALCWTTYLQPLYYPERPTFSTTHIAPVCYMLSIPTSHPRSNQPIPYLGYHSSASRCPAHLCITPTQPMSSWKASNLLPGAPQGCLCPLDPAWASVSAPSAASSCPPSLCSLCSSSWAHSFWTTSSSRPHLLTVHTSSCLS